MGSSSSKLFHNEPFPTNAGILQVVRLHERPTAGYGPSKMPHVSKRPTHPGRDAMGRIVIEDGLGRLRAGWPQSHAAVCSFPISADFFLTSLLWDTDHLNTYMKKNKMLAFCVISSHEAVMLIDIAYEKVCEKQTKAAVGFTAAIANLDANPNRLSEMQLQEVVMRLCNAYREFGVGALVMKEGKFFYRIIVPNVTEYTNHKAMYDERESKLRNAENARHVSTKRTRSGKNFDGGLKRTRSY